MAKATVIKGGKVRVFIGNNANPIAYSNPCGLTTRTITLSRNLEETTIPDCDNPDAVDWIGRGATNLSMGISGEGVLAEQSVDIWLRALDSTDSIPVKVEIELPTKTITFTGKMQIDSFEIGAPNGQTVTANISLQSDGEMLRASNAPTPSSDH